MIRIKMSTKQIHVILLIALFGLCSISTVFAQSTVYFFMGKIANTTSTVKVNGKEAFELRGPLQKTISPTPPLQYPYHLYSACKKKCVFKEEGKMLFFVDMKFTNATSGAVSNMVGEIQLNLSEGSEHYVKVTNKGLHDVQLKEITQKEAEKLLKNKKYVLLPEYIEE